MADFAGAVAAIEARLAAEWTTTPIAYANAPRPSVADPDTGDTVPWVYCEVTGAGATIEGVGVPGRQVVVDDGLISLQVFVPVNTGRGTALEYAVALGEIFRVKQFYDAEPGACVRTWTPAVDGGGQGSEDGLWWRCGVTIPFEFWRLA